MTDVPDNLEPLRHSDISPAIVVQQLQRELDSFDEIFVVTYDKNTGEPFVFMSGDVKNMVYAAHVLNGMATEISRGIGDF